MRTLARATGVAALTLAAATATGTGVAAADSGNNHAGVVFVQNDDPSGNVVFAYDRDTDGTLTEAGSYPTGGLGGVLHGSVIDHLASQGAVALDVTHQLLFAVNAGSDTVSVFAVTGDHLTPTQTLPSGGSFPVSVAVNGNLVYVLNARNGAAVSGYRIDRQHVQPINNSTLALGLDPTATPEFTHTPGQISFTPDGSQLVVTTKANGNDVDVFSVRPDGRLAAPTVNALPGAVPFAASYDNAGDLVLSEAGPNAVASFSIDRSGAITPVSTLATGQAATCWIAAAGGYFYASNAGSHSLTGLTSDSGTLAAVGQTSTDGGTVDAAASADGHYLYVQTGANGVVDEFAVASTGALTEIGTVTVPNAAGAEGIAAI